MSLKEYAMQEFKAAGWLDENGKFKDDMQKLICEQVLELLGLFAKHGHSGGSAPYAINMFKTLVSFEPLVPLTGKDWEWTQVNDDMWQNKRCSHVFKNKDGKAYDIHGKIFKEPNGSCYTSKYSHVHIKFPYTPKREYIDVKEN